MKGTTSPVMSVEGPGKTADRKCWTFQQFLEVGGISWEFGRDKDPCVRSGRSTPIISI